MKTNRKSADEKEVTTEEVANEENKTLKEKADRKNVTKRDYYSKLTIVIISVLLATVVNSIFMPWVRPLQSLILKREKVAIVDHSYSGYCSLIWHYTIRPYKVWRWSHSMVWAYLTFQVRELPGQNRVFDLSEIEEIRFAIKSNKLKSKIEFNIFINDSYTQYTKTDIDIGTEWRPVSVKLKELKPIHPKMPPTPNLKRVYSFGFAIKSFSELRSEEIYIDKITLVYPDGRERVFDDFEKRSDLNPEELLDIYGVEGRWIDGTGYAP